MLTNILRRIIIIYSIAVKVILFIVSVLVNLLSGVFALVLGSISLVMFIFLAWIVYLFAINLIALAY